MNLPTYPAYRESGIKWLGEIPKHWEVRRLKFRAKARTSNVDKLTKEDEVPVRLCNYVDVYYNERIQNDVNLMPATATPEEIERFGLRKGDVIVTKDSESWNDIAVPAYVAETLGDVVCGYHLAIIRGEEGSFSGEYLFRLFCSDVLNHQFRIAANGVTRFGLPKSAIDNAILIRPPIEEQEIIADFLDRETARIDALIEKKRKLLELLEEKRLAVITQAVTKGLDPSVPMKDSGIEWLGEVPAHWEISRIKHHCLVFNGMTPSRNVGRYWDDGNIPWLSSGKVNEDIVTEPSEYVTEDALAECSLSFAKTGSIIIGIVGQGRTRGLSAYLGIDATINQNMAAIVPNRDVSGRYLHFYLQHSYIPIREFGRGANQAALDCSLIREIPVPVPPTSEQEAIVAGVEKALAQHKLIVDKVSEAIFRLSEYRAALITNAVTGKVDVRGLAEREVA